MSTQHDGPALNTTAPNGPQPAAQRRPAGRIVAELGRPETPEETAARKAENSRAHRANQTTRNLILALVASLAVVLFTILIVVRPTQNLVKPVDYRTVAAQAQPSVSEPLVAPDLPKTWHSNAAELRAGNEQTTTWYIGLITPKQQFIGVEEGIHAADTWFGSLLGRALATGHVTIDGIRWTVYDQRGQSGVGNFEYSLASTIDGTNLVLHGSADNAEFDQLAKSIEGFLANAQQKN